MDEAMPIGWWLVVANLAVWALVVTWLAWGLRARWRHRLTARMPAPAGMEWVHAPGVLPELRRRPILDADPVA